MSSFGQVAARKCVSISGDRRFFLLRVDKPQFVNALSPHDRQNADHGDRFYRIVGLPVASAVGGVEIVDEIQQRILLDGGADVLHQAHQEAQIVVGGQA